MKRPCKFDKYKLGKNVPSDKTCRVVESELKGSTKWLDHLLWKIAQPQTLDIETTYSILAQLKPSISNLFFYKDPKPPFAAYRTHHSIEKILLKLDRDSSWDALVACLGLIQEAKYLNTVGVLFFTSRPTLRIFLRIASSYPMRFIAKDFFQYLKKYFLPNEVDKDIDNILENVNIEGNIHYYNVMTLFIEDLYILKKSLFAPTACLYFTDKYFNTHDVLQEVFTFKYNHDWKSVRKHPTVKKLTRAIRRWENSKEYDSSNLS